MSETLLERISRNKLDEIELSTELTAILTNAVLDQNPSHSLTEVAHALATSGTSSALDPLQVVPLLLDCEDSAAGEVLALLAECGNAKETVLSVQEWFGVLRNRIINEELEDEKVFLRLERLLLLYIGAIPRLKLRRRTPSETLHPLFEEVPRVIEAAGPLLGKSDGKSIIRLVCRLISCAISWTSQRESEEELAAVKSLCRNILSSSLADLSSSLDVRLAQRKFEEVNPRLFSRKPTGETTESDTILQECIDTALLLSFTFDMLLSERTSGAIILLSFLLSHTPSSAPSPNLILSSTSPVLIASLQANTSIDASLHILLNVLYPSTGSGSSKIDPDFIFPVATALMPLASTSPDPSVRLIAFRTLGTFLARAPPLDRMGLLREILTESPFPSLRVAAVGLLKEAVLEGLASSGNVEGKAGFNPFASPALLHTFGYVVLRPDPPELFSKTPTRASLDAFLETQEPKRLVECLAFYYILLMRDVNNVTGVRESSQIKSVEKEFLSPLRNSLNKWADLETPETVDGHAGMALAALETSLERIDEAYEKLGLESA